mmetsp:Transcript_10577/g.34942  ORF Transcript_10577/g.34942 Transcript_10577/m.34942 type:complete len:208 (-) Transcript_10577:2485-3108(-)
MTLASAAPMPKASASKRVHCDVGMKPPYRAVSGRSSGDRRSPSVVDGPRWNRCSGATPPPSNDEWTRSNGNRPTLTLPRRTPSQNSPVATSPKESFPQIAAMAILGALRTVAFRGNAIGEESSKSEAASTSTSEAAESSSSSESTSPALAATISMRAARRSRTVGCSKRATSGSSTLSFSLRELTKSVSPMESTPISMNGTSSFFAS